MNDGAKYGASLHELILFDIHLEQHPDTWVSVWWMHRQRTIDIDNWRRTEHRIPSIWD